MFKKIMEKLQNLAVAGKGFDPSGLNDPIAMQTQWTPVKSGGANFRTHKLVSIDPNRLEFKSTIGAKMFYLIFMLMGTGAMVVFSLSEISAGESLLNIEMIIPFLIGMISAPRR